MLTFFGLNTYRSLGVQSLKDFEEQGKYVLLIPTPRLSEGHYTVLECVQVLLIKVRIVFDNPNFLEPFHIEGLIGRKKFLEVFLSSSVAFKKIARPSFLGY